MASLQQIEPVNQLCAGSDNIVTGGQVPPAPVPDNDIDGYVVKYRVTAVYLDGGNVVKISTNDKRCKTFKDQAKAEAYRQKLGAELAKKGYPQIQTAIEEVHVKTSKKTPDNHEFNPRFQSRAIWLKFYPEAFGLVVDDAQGFKDVLQSIRTHCLDSLYMHGIVHDQCYTLLNPTDDSDDKLHMHLLFFSAARDSRGALVPFRMSMIYNILKAAGWQDRPDDREELYKSTKFPALKMHDDAKIVVYHTHETEEAIHDGKHQYDRSECVTNIPSDMLMALYDCYEHAFRKSADVATNGKAVKLQELTLEQKADLGDEAQHLGEAGKDFSEWWLAMPSHIKINTTLQNQCYKLYGMGFQAYLNDDRWKDHTRCFVYVYGSANSGKSYNAYNALTRLGCTYKAENSDTGKYDRLTAQHRCMIFDDTSVKKLLNVAEDAVCALPRRGSDNRPWVGDYAVVTHNLPFEEWLKQVQHVYEPAVLDAVKSRTFVVYVDENQNALIEQLATRGTPDKQRLRLTMFRDFMTFLTAGLSEYRMKKQIEPAFDLLAEAESMGLMIKKQPSAGTPDCKYLNTPCLYRNGTMCSVSSCCYEGGEV